MLTSQSTAHQKSAACEDQTTLASKSKHPTQQYSNAHCFFNALSYYRNTAAVKHSSCQKVPATSPEHDNMLQAGSLAAAKKAPNQDCSCINGCIAELPATPTMRPYSLHKKTPPHSTSTLLLLLRSQPTLHMRSTASLCCHGLLFLLLCCCCCAACQLGGLAQHGVCTLTA